MQGGWGVILFQHNMRFLVGRIAGLTYLLNTPFNFLKRKTQIIRKWLVQRFWHFQSRFPSSQFEGNWRPFNQVYLTWVGAWKANLC